MSKVSSNVGELARGYWIKPDTDLITNFDVNNILSGVAVICYTEINN